MDNKKKEIVSIRKTDKYTEIRLSNNLTAIHVKNKLKKILAIISSPLFFQNEILPDSEYRFLKNNKLNIAIFCHFLPYYSGGRYYSYMLASFLSKFANVTIISDTESPYEDDFKEWKTKANIVVDENYGSTLFENDFDLVIGVPFEAAYHAHLYSKKWKIPLAMLVFETPNFIRKYRDGADSNEQLWNPLKKVYNECDTIIACSKLSSIYAKEYFKKSTAEFHYLYPCVNEVVANKVLEGTTEKKSGVVFSSRSARFKSPVGVIREMIKQGYNGPYHLIGKMWSITKRNLKSVKEKNPQAKICFHGIIDDEEKFKIIKNSELLIVPSYFEGFGLPPLEALWMGTKVLAYDLEVLREVYKNRIEYVPLGNTKELANRAIEILKENSNQKRITNISNLRQWEDKVLDILPTNKNKYKLSVGMIAFDDPYYVEESLKAVYDLAHEIIIVEGKVEKYPGKCSDGKEMRDKLAKFILKQDPQHKIQYLSRYGTSCWKDKIEMQNKIAELVTGDIYLKLDSDEIWKEKDILKVLNEFKENQNLTIACVPFYHFWTNFETIAVDHGGKWSTKVPRFWRWQKEFRHIKSFNYFVDKFQIPVWKGSYLMQTIEDVYCYHFGYVKPLEAMNKKWEYYLTRGIEKYSNPKNIYKIWKNLSDITQPNQKRKSWAREITLALPSVLMNHPFRGTKDVRRTAK